MYKMWSIIFPDREIRQEKEKKNIQTMELSLFYNVQIPYYIHKVLGNLYTEIKNKLIIDNKVSKISGSKANFQKLAVFLSTSEHFEKQVNEIIPFTLVSDKIKYLSYYKLENTADAT